MNKIFVVFKKQPWEKVCSYSLVSKDDFDALPDAQILKTKEIPDKLYTSEELNQLRDKLCKS